MHCTAFDLYLGAVFLPVPSENGVLGQNFRVVEEKNDLLKDLQEDHVLVTVLLHFDDEGALRLGGGRQPGGGGRKLANRVTG